METRDIDVAATPVNVIGAAKGTPADGSSPKIVLALGDDLHDCDFFAVTVDDAARLRALIDTALRSPPPRWPTTPPKGT